MKWWVWKMQDCCYAKEWKWYCLQKKDISKIEWKEKRMKVNKEGEVKENIKKQWMQRWKKVKAKMKKKSESKCEATMKTNVKQQWKQIIMINKAHYTNIVAWSQLSQQIYHNTHQANTVAQSQLLQQTYHKIHPCSKHITNLIKWTSLHYFNFLHLLTSPVNAPIPHVFTEHSH